MESTQKEVAFQIRIDDDYTLETNDKRFAVKKTLNIITMSGTKQRKKLCFTNAVV